MTSTTQAFKTIIAQFKGIKKQHPDTILMFHLNEEYVTICEDAETLAAHLDVACVEKDGVAQAIIPATRAEINIKQLVDKGYRVAVCEQVALDEKRAQRTLRRVENTTDFNKQGQGKLF